MNEKTSRIARECKIVLSIVEDSIDKVTGLAPVAKGGK